MECKPPESDRRTNSFDARTHERDPLTKGTSTRTDPIGLSGEPVLGVAQGRLLLFGSWAPAETHRLYGVPFSSGTCFNTLPLGPQPL